MQRVGDVRESELSRQEYDPFLGLISSTEVLRICLVILSMNFCFVSEVGGSKEHVLGTWNSGSPWVPPPCKGILVTYSPYLGS